jgi:hypothetical protein
MITAIKPIRMCPQCKGTGQDYNLRHRKLMACELCYGRGYVSERCMGCGRPATKYWPPKQQPIIHYCGLETCFNALVTLRKSSKPVIVRAAGFTMVEEQLQEIDRANRRVSAMEELKRDITHRLGESVRHPHAL